MTGVDIDRAGCRKLPSGAIIYFISKLIPYALTRVAAALALAAVCAAPLAGCSDNGHALLLKVRGQSYVETFDLVVYELPSKQILLETRDQAVDAADPNRDISLEGSELKLAIEFSDPGEYLVHLIGYGGTAAQVALRPFEVRGLVHAYSRLTLLANGLDDDHDGYPECGAYTDCGAGSPIDCAYLDCDDDDDAVHPLGEEICGNGKDDDCDRGCGAAAGEGDEPCEDGDGDGAIGADDCDDTNPCRAPSILEARNLCDAAATEFSLPQACLDYLAKEGLDVPLPPYCGDGVDQNCGGQDVPCVIDDDCDKSPASVDCNDHDPDIHPEALERCDDDVDNNCNGVVNEGCAPCDVDGDGHAERGLQATNCTGADGLPLPTDDDDDYDAGIYTGSSASTAGAEGGHKTGALREWCSRSKRNRDGDKFEAEVDHDGDGVPASEDGCPPVACDGDGDGYQNASCNPPADQQDCDDSDPHTFEGAPERCGDGIDQSCDGADIPCGGDADGDGYLGADDPNDDANDPRAATMHPWAPELCDGLDNDGDGLIDEGNPDHLGQAITSSISCTDDNDGECAKTRGRCACSRIEIGHVDENGNRDACDGEDLTPDATSPRCVGAGQPGKERCNQDDLDCNGRPDDPEGLNLIEKETPCGIAQGDCTQGTVQGCDLNNPVANQALVTALLPDFNPYWVCKNSDGTAANLPIPEVCNGKDDDCDGQLPIDERDTPPIGDSDGYLACSGCSSGDARTDLAAGLEGCGDCSPVDGDVFPTQTELCNGIDDNCSAGVSDDGAGECTATQLCCFTGCEDTQTDVNNCGGCGARCSDVPGTDSCVGGQCVCGTTGAPCPPSSDPCVDMECSGGRCTPVTVSDCCTSASECDDNNLCTDDGCQNNRCTHDWRPGCCLRDSDCIDNDPCTLPDCNTGQNTCKPAKC